MRRQNEAHLSPFPIWDDVRTFRGEAWRGVVDVVSGGFPCQDISAAGKGAGISGERSGLWREMARIVREVGPRFVFVENSPVLTSRGLGTVLGDLAGMGFDARWCVLGGFEGGSPSDGKRIWVVGSADHGSDGEEDELGVRSRRQREILGENPEGDLQNPWRKTYSKLLRVGNGVANRMDRVRAIGNGQVPAVAQLAWETLTASPETAGR